MNSVPLCPFHGNQYDVKGCGVCEFIWRQEYDKNMAGINYPKKKKKPNARMETR